MHQQVRLPATVAWSAQLSIVIKLRCGCRGACICSKGALAFNNGMTGGMTVTIADVPSPCTVCAGLGNEKETCEAHVLQAKLEVWALLVVTVCLLLSQAHLYSLALLAATERWLLLSSKVALLTVLLQAGQSSTN